MRLDPLKFEHIRSLRIDRDLKQREVAEILNISQNTYSQYELGIINFPVDALIRLAEFYNTSVDYLVGLTDDPRPYPKKK
ncbi:MAG: helix-turn-helix transcriptional regulator [Oscillospiraceae bacterium]|nr:helix-turn-helix transcriptional regulator [Oscillospiraceae bacterium]